MKFSRFILANLFRKKIRLILTIGSFAVALFLFTFLAVVKERVQPRRGYCRRRPPGDHQSRLIDQHDSARLPRQDFANPGRQSTSPTTTGSVAYIRTKRIFSRSS